MTLKYIMLGETWYKRTNTYYGLETLLCWTIADFACSSVLFSSLLGQNPSFHIFSTISPYRLWKLIPNSSPSIEGQDQELTNQTSESLASMWWGRTVLGLGNQCIFRFLLAPEVGSGTSTVLKSDQRILTSRLLLSSFPLVTKSIGPKDLLTVPGHFAQVRKKLIRAGPKLGSTVKSLERQTRHCLIA